MAAARLREEVMRTQRRILLVVGAFLLAVGALVTPVELVPGGVVRPLLLAARELGR